MLLVRSIIFCHCIDFALQLQVCGEQIARYDRAALLISLFERLAFAALIVKHEDAFAVRCSLAVREFEQVCAKNECSKMQPSR